MKTSTRSVRALCASTALLLSFGAAHAGEQDATFHALTTLLRGVYTDGEQRIHFFDIDVSDAQGVLVGEFVAVGHESMLEGQVLAQFIRRRGDVRLRMYRFPGGTRLAPGLWAAPELIPEIEAGPMDIVADLVVTTDNPENPTWFEAVTLDPTPVHTRRAVEMTTKIRVDKDGLSIYEVGFDGAGEQVWTYPEKGATTFARIDNPFTPERRENGLIVMDLTEPSNPDAKKGEKGDQYTVHYYGWLTNGFLFDTSKQPGREPFSLTIPGGVIPGWNEGLVGMREGTVRRLYIPPHMAYGSRGAGGVIPPDAWLVFDVELVSLKKADAAAHDGHDHDDHDGHDHPH